MSWQKDEIESRLSPTDRRRIFEELGFYFNGHRAGSDGWIKSVLGPEALGEGKKPNFAVNTNTGAVRDHGSSGYRGSLYDAVKDAHGFTFPETLEWIAGFLGLSEPPRKSAVVNTPPDLSGNVHKKGSSSVDNGPEPVASLDTVSRWAETMRGDTPEAIAARSYLTGRGLSEGIIEGARLGLSYKPARRDGITVSWWIIIPVVRRPDADHPEPVVVSLKGFAFDPEGKDWKRGQSGRKIARNGGPAALYNCIPGSGDPFDGPVLVCEGELDALAATSFGFNAVTGTGGAATFKREWASNLARLPTLDERGVVLCYDGDTAGRKGAQTAAQTLHAAGLPVRIASLPDGQDVSDVLQRGGQDALNACLNEAAPYEPKPSETAAPFSDAISDKLRTAFGFDVNFVRKRSIETLRRCANHTIKANAKGSKNQFPPSGAPRIPSEVYERLPPLLRSTAQTFTRTHKRDVYLTSALACLSACMPNVGGYYGEIPNLLRPNLYLAIVAGAAGGKSAMRFGRWLTDSVNAHIKKESERALQRWKNAKEAAKDTDTPFDDPKPPERSLMLPANTSAAAFHEGLKHRNERALVVETEIDTLTNALGQEWGKFDDTLRKAYHHERAAYRRKADGRNVTLENPQLSVVLSGTPRQFETLMGSTENGLYSRFALYYFEAPEGWISQCPSAAAIESVESFRKRHARRVLTLWEHLANRTDALRFVLTDSQWARHDAAHRQLMKRALLREWGRLADVVKRAGIVAFRIAMICAVLRAHSERPDVLASADVLEATDDDVTVGLTLAHTLAEHSLRYANAHLSEGEDPDPWMKRIAVMLNGVGEAFTSGEAYAVAEESDLDVSNRTLRDDLKRAARQGLIHAVHKNGRWTKAPNGLEGSSDASDVAD